VQGRGTYAQTGQKGKLGGLPCEETNSNYSRTGGEPGGGIMTTAVKEIVGAKRREGEDAFLWLRGRPGGGESKLIE